MEADSLSRNHVLVAFDAEDEEVLPVANLVELQAVIDDQSAHREWLREEKEITNMYGVALRKLRGRQRI